MKTINNLPKTALLDTTFLVDLASPKSMHHQNAKDYAMQMMSNGTVFHLSALVMAEFGVKGNLDNVIGYFKPKQITFSREDAAAYAELVKLHPGIFNFKLPDKERVVIDLMLMAQAKVRGIEAVITTDSAMASVFTRGTNVKAIDVKISYADFLTLQSPLFNPKNLN